MATEATTPAPPYPRLVVDFDFMLRRVAEMIAFLAPFVHLPAGATHSDKKIGAKLNADLLELERKVRAATGPKVDGIIDEFETLVQQFTTFKIRWGGGQRRRDHRIAPLDIIGTHPRPSGGGAVWSPVPRSRSRSPPSQTSTVSDRK